MSVSSTSSSSLSQEPISYRPPEFSPKVRVPAEEPGVRVSTKKKTDCIAKDCLKKAWTKTKKGWKVFDKHVITPLKLFGEYGEVVNQVALCLRAADKIVNVIIPAFKFSILFSTWLERTKVGGVLQLPGIILGIGFSLWTIACAKTGGERAMAVFQFFGLSGALADVGTKIAVGLKDVLHISASASSAFNWGGFVGVIFSSLSLIPMGKKLYDTHRFSNKFDGALGKPKKGTDLINLSTEQFKTAMEIFTKKKVKIKKGKKKGEIESIDRTKADLSQKLQICHHIPLFEKKIDFKGKLAAAIDKAQNHPDLAQRKIRQISLVQILRNQLRTSQILQAMQITAAIIGIIGIAIIMLTPFAPIGWGVVLLSTTLSIGLLCLQKSLSRQLTKDLATLGSNKTLKWVNPKYKDAYEKQRRINPDFLKT